MDERNLFKDKTDNTQKEPEKYSFDSVYLISILLRHKLFIISFVILTTAVITFFAFRMPDWHASTVSVVPPKSPVSGVESGGGAISSVLKEFGVSKLSGESEGYSILVLLHSRTLKDSIIKEFDLAKEYDIPDTEMTQIRKELEDNIEVIFEKEGNYTITIWDKNPQKAANIANRIITLTNNMNIDITKQEASINKNYLEDKLKLTDSTLEDLGKSLSKFSKDKMLFSPLDQAKSLSTMLAEIKSSLMQNEIIYDIYKKNYGENDAYTQMQKQVLDETRKKLSDVESKPGYAGNFTLNEASNVGINYLKLYTEFETYTKLRAFLLPMLEKTKLDEFSSTNSFYIVDRAIPSEKKDKPHRSVMIIGAFGGSFVLACLLILLINSIKLFIKRLKQFNKSIE